MHIPKISNAKTFILQVFHLHYLFLSYFMSNKTKSRRAFIKLAVFSGISGIISPLKSIATSSRSFKFDLKKSVAQFQTPINQTLIRKLFPLELKKSYFNLASHSLISNEVINRISEILTYYSTVAINDRKPMEQCRESLAKLFKVDKRKIALTRNATESANIVAKGLELNANDEVIITTHEHIGGASPWIALAKEKGIKVIPVELDLAGKTNLERIEKNITPKTQVIYVSHITCTTGMCLPVESIVRLCQKKNIISCIDGAQAMGMIPLDIGKINPDFYIGCGHKWLLGPRGTGILYAKDTSLLTPVFVGSYSDADFNLAKTTITYRDEISREEYGTRNIALYGGLSSSIELLESLTLENISQYASSLATYFRHQLEDDSKITFLSPKMKKYSSSIVTIRLLNTNNRDAVNNLLNKHNIFARWIYECNLDAIRISFSILNSEQEVDRLILTLRELNQ